MSITEASYANRVGPSQWLARFAEHQTLRLEVWLSRASLDEQLAEGRDPGSDPALLLRARQLRSQRNRSRLASWIERLIAESETPPPPCLTTRVSIAGEKVVEARDQLQVLAQVLRHDEQARPRGIAMVERLLTDGGSVLYRETVRGALALQVRAALDLTSPSRYALDPR